MINIITFNIRYDGPTDYPHTWSQRLPIIKNIVNKFKPDILGTQEGRQKQIYELSLQLEPLCIADSHRKWITERMYPSLFYNPNSLELKNSGDIWLSAKPQIPASKSFGSAFPRLATYAKFKDLASLKEFVVCNVHLDHLESRTRLEQIKILLYEMAMIYPPDKFPYILMGDFNDQPHNEVYKYIFNTYPHMKDSWMDLKMAEEGTHHSFDGENKNTKRIDWILLNKLFEIRENILIKDNDNGIWPSDHFPYLSKIKF